MDKVKKAIILAVLKDLDNTEKSKGTDLVEHIAIISLEGEGWEKLAEDYAEQIKEILNRK